VELNLHQLAESLAEDELGPEAKVLPVRWGICVNRYLAILRRHFGIEAAA
jgi:hypothetical protein